MLTNTWYHGTSNENEILCNGFSLDFTKNGRRFGNGVYFASTKEESLKYGTKVIVAEIPSNEISVYPIKEWCLYENAMARQHGFGYQDHIRSFIEKQGFKCLCIEWLDGEKELVVFDHTLIEIKSAPFEAA